MPNDLFDDNDSDNNISFKKSEYAKKYDTLRRKEELLKLKNKYGEQFEDSSDSSSDDDDDVELTEAFEKDFFKTLSCLKNKDPKIYDKDVNFFNAEGDIVQKDKKEKYKPIKIRDYNRELILKEHKSDDEEELDERPISPTYVQEQNEIKNNLKSIVNDDDERDSDEIGGLFVKKKKSKSEEEEEEKSYREWLKGQSEHLDDNIVESELKPLKDYWSDPLLDKDEAFLRDYVLNQRFKDPTSTNKIPSYEEIVNDSEDNISEDEILVGKQTEFEHKFNFRFEEPDQEFIKQYPRTLEHTMRKKSDKRAQKRTEIKQRKAEEKLKKKEEVSRMKSMKLKEIQEKISKIKEITGNDELAFNNDDIEGEFDPDEHDRRMREIFDKEYYDHDVDRKKPTFPELDEELGIENWDTWGTDEGNPAELELHCEDQNFNMDCDYDPAAAKKNLLDDIKDTIEGKNKRKRKRKGKFSEALEREKPLYDPEKLNKTLSQYVDEYYKLDCEDVIGDLPCRFKYREVPACNYGLTLEEILMADDKELNRWYSLKKTLAYRPEHLQKNDQKVYEKKAKDVALKMKILPSLFKQQEEIETEDVKNDDVEEVSKKKKKKNKKKRKNEIINNFTESEEKAKIVIEENIVPKIKKHKKDSKLSEDAVIIDNDAETIHENKHVSENVNDVKIKSSKKRKRESEACNGNSTNIFNEAVSEEKPKSKKKKMKQLNSDETVIMSENKKTHKLKSKGIIKHKNYNKTKNVNDVANKLSDERLKAFGLNPKKYRSFMKFKKH